MHIRAHNKLNVFNASKLPSFFSHSEVYHTQIQKISKMHRKVQNADERKVKVRAKIKTLNSENVNL